MREPLVHFLCLACLIFAAHGLLGGRVEPEEAIVVTPAKIEQMASIFARTWQRPATADELKGLIDDYVKEEIYVREAMRLGIDKDDTVIRRRLRMKMEFLNDAQAEAMPATGADLTAYLAAHPDKFQEPPRVAFEQVYLDAQKRGAAAQADAAAILGSLKKDASFATSAGDPTLLPPSMPLTNRQGIAQLFGDDFAAAVVTLAPGHWQGPIGSGFGLHLVKVTGQEAGRVPALAEIRPQVEREWLNDRREAIARQKLDELLKRYKVTVAPFAPPAGAAQ
ncbi:MAG: peptidyl-prolyl cis-trans isomerase [Aestuariivirga sp.]|nr:peptidyl-prolyl cis-trans isomerase [Aestuariivirga sp.]